MTDTSPANQPLPDAAGLIDKLSRQRDLYLQLKQLSDQQAGLIEEGQTEQLLSVLSQRQSLVDQLGGLTRQLAPLREAWPKLAGTLADDQRDRINGLLGEVELLLESIVQQDDRDRAKLSAAKQQVSSQLSQVSSAGQAVSAYQAAPKQQAPRFTDRQG
ncbi:MAG: flagellar export chaperone FlgN [Phycisphaeraceae bacterium]